MISPKSTELEMMYHEHPDICLLLNTKLNCEQNVSKNLMQKLFHKNVEKEIGCSYLDY